MSLYNRKLETQIYDILLKNQNGLYPKDISDKIPRKQPPRDLIEILLDDYEKKHIEKYPFERTRDVEKSLKDMDPYTFEKNGLWYLRNPNDVTCDKCSSFKIDSKYGKAKCWCNADG